MKYIVRPQYGSSKYGQCRNNSQSSENLCLSGGCCGSYIEMQILNSDYAQKSSHWEVIIQRNARPA